MPAPYPPSYFEGLIAKPGQGICLRIINRIRFRVAMIAVARWLFNEKGEFSDQFKSDLCGINCAGTTPTTESTTTGLTTTTVTTTSTTTLP